MKRSSREGDEERPEPDFYELGERVDRLTIDEDAADRMERELREEQEFDRVHRRIHFENRDYRAMRQHEDDARWAGGRNPTHNRMMEAGWFRRVLAANSPRGPDGRAYATADFPVAMAKRQYSIPGDRWQAPNPYEPNYAIGYDAEPYEQRRDRYLAKRRAQKRHKDGE